MNHTQHKRMIVLIALATCVFALPASAETIEIRGAVVELTAIQSSAIIWDAYNFAGFWYDPDDDLMTETLTIANDTLTPSTFDRTIDVDCLTYQTCSVSQHYALYSNEGLTVAGDAGYYIEGWMGQRYVAIDGRADKLCKLLVEFEYGDKKTLATGEAWDLGGGFSLEAIQIDPAGDKVWFCLSKDGLELDSEVISAGGVYTYTADIGGEDDVPVFSCYVYAVFRGTDTNIVQIKYVFLIDDVVLVINTGDTYGIMEATIATASTIVLENDETVLDLDAGTVKCIMGDMYFKIADDDTAIRFYPFVEHTTPGTYEIRGTVQNLAGPQSSAIAWNAYNFAGFWYDPDDDLMTETLTIADGTLSTFDRTIEVDCLTYQTCSVYRQYALYSNEGLTVAGDAGYYIEGWMGQRYVAIDGRADGLCEPLVEFEYGDKKTLATGEAWDMGGGFLLEAKQIDLEGNKVWFCLSKNGRELDSEVVSAGGVYTYTADIGGEYDVPVFSCYVDAIFRETNTTTIKYVFLIDDAVLEINIGDEFGVMEVRAVSSIQVTLKNGDSSIVLNHDTIEHIMGDTYYFKTADDASVIRFHPFVERTISGGAITPPNITSFAPSSPVSDTEGATRTFNVTADQTANVVWLINGTIVQDANTSVTTASYTNTSAALGVRNVSAVVSNANGTIVQTWIWNVTAGVPGDVTGDSVVNIGDATLLFNWVSFPNERETTYALAEPDNANVNGDTTTNIGDAVLLFNWVSFPNEQGTTYVLK